MYVLFLTFCIHAKGQQIDRTEAEIVAKTELLITKGIDVDVVTTHSFDSLGHTLLYEVVTDGCMHVLVTGNRLCMPVVARYESESTESIFSQYDSLPCGLRYFLQEYKNQVCYSFETPPVSSPYELEWNEMETGVDVYLPKGLGSVPPLMTTCWGQSSSNSHDNGPIDIYAYNYYAPSGSGCGHCKAGCVAVAMAQIMNYWKYPVIQFEERQFDWCNMVDSLRVNYPNYQHEKEAVSWLIQQCGEKAHMSFGCNKSKSNLYKAKNGLDDFGYNNDSDHQWRIFNRRRWVEHLRSNLDSGWVVLYGASGGLSELFPSHAFVCDGYDRDGKFHFNWGWNGLFNEAYLTVDSLCPGEHDYRTFASALFDLRPPEDYDEYCGVKIRLEEFYGNFFRLHWDIPSDYAYLFTPNTLFDLISVRDSNIYPSSWRTIPSGATAEYVAHREVVLRPGFTAERGSDFTARIEPCETCETAMLELRMAEGDASEETEADTTLIPRVYRIGDTTFEVRQSALRLYPNPTEQQLTIGSAEEVKDIRLYDQRGHAVYRWYVSRRGADGLTLEVGDIPTGTYIVHVTTLDGRTHMGRFVKK